MALNFGVRWFNHPKDRDYELVLNHVKWRVEYQTLRMQMAILIVNQTTAMEIQFRRKTSRNGWFSIAVQSFRTQFVHWAVSRVVAVSTPGHFFRKNMYECLPGQKGYPRSAKIVFVQGRRAISWRCVCQPSSRYNQLYFVVISSSRYRKWLIDVAVLNQFCLLEDFFTPRSLTNYASEISGRLVDTSQMSRTTSPSEYMVGQFFWVILQLIYLIKWRHPGSGSNYKGDIWTIQGSKPIFFLSTIRRCCASAGYRTRNNARSIRGVGKPGAAVRSEHNNYGNGKLKKKQVDQEHYLQNRHRKFEPFFFNPWTLVSNPDSPSPRCGTRLWFWSKKQMCLQWGLEWNRWNTVGIPT